MGKRILRETRELLGELLDEGRKIKISGSYYDEDQVGLFLSSSRGNAGVPNPLTLGDIFNRGGMTMSLGDNYENLSRGIPQTRSKLQSVTGSFNRLERFVFDFPLNSVEALGLVGDDGMLRSFGGNPVKPFTVPLEGMFGPKITGDAVSVAQLNLKDNGEVGKGEVLFALLCTSSVNLDRRGEGGLDLGNFSVKSFLGNKGAKLGATYSPETIKTHFNEAMEKVERECGLQLKSLQTDANIAAFVYDESIVAGAYKVADRIEKAIAASPDAPSNLLVNELPKKFVDALDSVVVKILGTTETIGLMDNEGMYFQSFPASQLAFDTITESRLKIIPASIRSTELSRKLKQTAVNAYDKSRSFEIKRRADAAVSKFVSDGKVLAGDIDAIRVGLKSLEEDESFQAYKDSKIAPYPKVAELSKKVSNEASPPRTMALKNIVDAIIKTTSASTSLSETRLLLAELFPPRRPSLVTELALYSRRGLITEGAKEKAIDAVQFLIGAAVEYGIDVPTLGAGAPLGSAAETVIDAAFAAESITSAVDAIDSVVSKAGKFKDIFNSAMAARTKIKGDLSGFYADVKRIVQEGLELLGKDAQAKVKELSEELGKIVKGMIEKVLDPIGKAIKFLIPDATIGAAAAEAIKALLMELAENCFDMVKGALGKAGKFAKFITDPDAVPNFLEDAIPKLVTFLQQGAKKLEDTSLLKAAVTGGGAGIILKELGPVGLNKLAGILGDKKGDIVGLARKITGTLIPIVFTLLALMQVMLKGEYVSEDIEAKREKAKAAAGTEKETPKESKRLRGSVVSETHLLLRELGV